MMCCQSAAIAQLPRLSQSKTCLNPSLRLKCATRNNGAPLMTRDQFGRYWSRLGQSNMGGDHAQTLLESRHTRWPPLSIPVCIAGSRKDVQELYQLCKHESGKDFCLGYISGVADHMLLNGAFLRSHGKEFKEGDRDLLTDLSACLKTTGSFEGVVQTELVSEICTGR